MQELVEESEVVDVGDVVVSVGEVVGSSDE